MRNFLSHRLFWVPFFCFPHVQKDLDAMFEKLDSKKGQLPSEDTIARVKPVLSTALLSHQEEGLAWLVLRETNPDPTGMIFVPLPVLALS